MFTACGWIYFYTSITKQASFARTGLLAGDAFIYLAGDGLPQEGLVMSCVIFCV